MRPKSYENKKINFIKLEKNWFKKKGFVRMYDPVHNMNNSMAAGTGRRCNYPIAKAFIDFIGFVAHPKNDK